MTELEARLPVIGDVLDAARRIAPYVKRTPILRSRSLSAYCGRDVFIKAEHLQTTGAYKIRGGTNFVRSILEEGSPLQGVIAASSGNHGLGLAYAAREANLRATIVLPDNVVAVKRAAIEDFGARTILADPLDTARVAAEVATREGLVNVPPFDDWRIIAGQGTVALEALEDSPSVDAIVVPVGGGALAAGTTLAARHHASSPRVFGVEPIGASDTAQSLSVGHRVEIREPRSVADGLLPSQPGIVTFAVNQTGLAGIVTIGDEDTLRAMRFVAERMKQLIEPSAAVSIAALAGGRIPGDGPVLVIFSGGNVDLRLFVS